MAGYDMTPWKVRICPVDWDTCDGLAGHRVRITDLPPAPEPGRIPSGADHVHLVPKLSADQRDARSDHKWRALLLATARCIHGRTQGDICYSCPAGYAPDRSGTRVGTTYAGQPVVIPSRDDQNNLSAWIEDD